MVNFKKFKIFAETEQALKAAELFSLEIKDRTGTEPSLCSKDEANFLFVADDEISRDGYKIDCSKDSVCISASGIRGFIFGFGMFLRKIVPVCGVPVLVEDISGSYNPDKVIRGHQIGYRTTPNTYDAWSYDDYRRYYLDMMFFGTNTVEHIPYERGVSKRNRLMKYDEEEFLVRASSMADEFDLDVSLWHPNNDGETVEFAAERRGRLYETVPRLDVVFPPGGDPGEFSADEFVLRCKEISKALKKVHPNAQMWPSAQQPHSQPAWGEDFIAEMEKQPDEIDGVITGPNHAFDLETLRRRLPSKYPIRLYPDITHNVRCEYPVHFDRDDWHFALTTGLSRECTNPRPREYRLIHRLTRRYVVGSVSYSEGITDDVNKMVWADMDFFPDCDLRTTLLDYARLFFYGADPDEIADGILALELNWQCDPAENPTIDRTFETFELLNSKYTFLADNWRFLQLLMRAKCDWVLRHRRLFELNLIRLAEKEIKSGNLVTAKEILDADYDEQYKKERADITALAQKLFALIGLQSDIENYCADNWERGAILETIDLPVTDRKWLLGRLDTAYNSTDPVSYIKKIINRNKVRSDEYYFSVALNGLEECGVLQNGEIYMNFQGDRPNVNTGEMPVAMFKVYDNLTFKCKVGGLDYNGDYKLKITYMSKKSDSSAHHKITANGYIIYEGAQFGGEKDEEFDAAMLAPGFETASYVIPKSVIQNGCIDLEFSEPDMGVMFSEFRITHE
ncbi:MAG: hypothetical protein E7547_02950 [Ruminococcaceae bacterium]|nr:hypothetical protein [Oscillospiraceae bacterium]